MMSAHKAASKRYAYGDYRPNRAVQGTSRTSALLRKAGYSNDTTHRDLVIARRLSALSRSGVRAESKGALQHAATLIQDVWRKFTNYRESNRANLDLRQTCALVIQRVWRAWHVVRRKYDTAATRLQSTARGYLTRLVIRLNLAALTIQRHVAGYLCRKELARLNAAAVDVQRLARGFLGRQYFDLVFTHRSNAAVVVQGQYRSMLAGRAARERVRERILEDKRVVLALTCQRYYRGKTGRVTSTEIRVQYREEHRLYAAARKIQALIRRDLATKAMGAKRGEQMARYNNAATFMRKMWLGRFCRRRYLELKSEFEGNVDAVIVIQRFGRGFLVRLGFWRESVEAQQKHWAVVEVQRLWRGYAGRLRWEQQYELFWCQMMAAVKVQRNVRMWLASLRVFRARMSAVHAKVEAASRLANAATAIQAAARGMVARQRVAKIVERVVAACVKIQSVWLGRRVRVALWHELRQQSVLRLQGLSRGFLVRARLKQVVAAVEAIQKLYRCFARTNPEERARLQSRRTERQGAADTIQSRWRQNRPTPGQRPDAGSVYHCTLLRVERKWGKAAVAIQRAVRVKLLGWSLERARKVQYHYGLTRD